jgi:hypothetical protein
VDDIRNGNCPLCNHHEVIEGQPAEQGSVEVPSWSRRPSRPTSRSFAHRLNPRRLFAREMRPPEEPLGRLQNYMCRSCGFTQWFVNAPGEVPVGEEFRTRLIRGTPRGDSYR